MKKQIPIFFAIDNSYAPFLSVALNSLADHSSKNREYDITVLYMDLEPKNMYRLKTFERDNIKITFKNMTVNLDAFEDRHENRFRCDYILAIYFRLFIANMFSHLDKAIYLDSDIVLNDDIANLYDIDIKDNLLGGCYDTSISHNSDLYGYTEKAIGVKKTEYINSGILLMNLKEMRQQKFQEHFLNLLNKYHFDSVAPDQDYINAICNGKIYYLDRKWDAMPDEMDKPLKQPSLIHYNLFSKPWNYSGIQYEEYFWRYAKTSGYLTEILTVKESFNQDKREKDMECMKSLIERAREISKSSVTFNTALKNGEKIRIC